MKKNLPTQTISNGNATPLERWIDKQDILQMLHISSRTLQTWRSLGLLPYYKIAGKIYYRQSELYKMLEKYRHGGKT